MEPTGTSEYAFRKSRRMWGYLVILLSRKACAAEGTTLRLSVDTLIIHDLEGLGIRQLLYKTESSIK